MASIADPGFRFSALEQRVLEWLAVPSAPEIPDGSPDSIRVFRAGENYYAWSILVWAAACALVLVALLSASIGIAQGLDQVPGWARMLIGAVLIVVWSVYVLAVIVTFIARRINYRLRWYIVTDRSLRIRSGVFQVNELTMTYSNIQEIRVASGPLQLALGLADVEVQAAGGGGSGDKQRHSGHIGRFAGLSNANEVRDLMVARLRQYRDSGLGGDTAHAAPQMEPAALAAAQAMLDEARALRRTLATGGQ